MAGIDEHVILAVTSDIYSNGDTVFVDKSNYARPITKNGSVTHSSILPHFFSTSIESKISYASRLQCAPSTDFDMGSGDFTIDLWIYDSNRALLKDVFGKGWKLSIGTSGQIYFDGAAGSGSFVTPDGSLPYRTWAHIALVRYGDVWTIYVNGVSKGSTTNSSALIYYSGNTFRLGPNTSGSTLAVSYRFDEFRFSKGIARWITDFTPPTAPYTGLKKITITPDGGAIGGGVAPSHIPNKVFASTGGGIAGGIADIKIPQYSIISSAGALGGGIAPYITNPNNKGPVQHWTMNNITGTLIANEREGHPPLDMQSTSRLQVPGVFDKAIDWGPWPSLPLATTEEIFFSSISLWFKRYDWYNHVYFLSDGYNDYDSVRWFHDFSTFHLGIRSSAGTHYFDLKITDLNWHHLCVVKTVDSTAHFLYLDGVKSSTSLTSHMPHFSFLGLNGDSTNNRNPYFDNVQVYDRILSDSEVVWLSKATSDFTYAPKVPFYWHKFSGGGGVVGGIATQSQSVSYTFAGTGGAVGGGSSKVVDNTALVDASYPNYNGDAFIFVLPQAEINGSYPEYIGDIETGYDIVASYPDYIGSVLVQHLNELDVNGNYFFYKGSAELVTTRLLSTSGIYPRFFGSANINTYNLLSSDGSYPHYQGMSSIEITKFVSVFGRFPSYSGVSILDLGLSDTELLISFDTHEYNKSSETLSESPEEFLEFIRGD